MKPVRILVGAAATSVFVMASALAFDTYRSPLMTVLLDTVSLCF